MSMETHQKQEELGKTAKIKAETIQKKYANMVASLQAFAENIRGLSADSEQVGRQTDDTFSKSGILQLCRNQ